MNRLGYWLRLVAWLPAFVAVSLALSEEPRFPVKMERFAFQVRNEKGEPIRDVEIDVRGVRCAEAPGSWYSWPSPNAGQNHRVTTDEKGEAEISFPTLFGIPPDYRTTTVLTFVCSHPHYIPVDQEAKVTARNATIEMKPGCHIEFSAMDPGGRPVDRLCVFMPKAFNSKWILENGTIRSSSVPDGQWQTMLVSPPEKGPTLFSGVLPARFVTGQNFTIRNVILAPGVCLQGTVSDDVPRPIEDGIVVAYCQPKPTKEALAKHEAIGWQEGTKIEADGSFRFDSLPRTGTIQLIALCRGWVIVDVPRDDEENGQNSRFFKRGVLLKLNELKPDDALLDGIELPMEFAGSVEVKVRTREGMPIAGSRVSTWPNQMLEKSGSQLLGTAGNMRKWMERQITGESMYDYWREQESSRYIQQTNGDGIAILRDIPLDRELTIELESEWYQPIDSEAQPKRSLRFKLHSVERKPLELIVEPIAPDAPK